MMMNFKKIIAFIISMAAVADFYLPVSAFAQREGFEGREGVFCERLPELSSRIEARRDTRQSRVDSKRQIRDERLTARRAAREQREEQRRARHQERRAAQFARLEGRAETDEQKQAVEEFKTTITNAIASRQQAIQGAIQEHRQGFDGVIAERQSNTNTAMIKFSQAVETALSNAQADCDDGVDPKTIRETLRESFKAASAEYRSDLQSLPTLRASLQPILDAFHQAVQKAIQDFKAVVQEAQEGLKQAFGLWEVRE